MQFSALRASSENVSAALCLSYNWCDHHIESASVSTENNSSPLCHYALIEGILWWEQKTRVELIKKRMENKITEVWSYTTSQQVGHTFFFFFYLWFIWSAVSEHLHAAIQL